VTQSESQKTACYSPAIYHGLSSTVKLPQPQAFIGTRASEPKHLIKTLPLLEQWPYYCYLFQVYINFALRVNFQPSVYLFS